MVKYFSKLKERKGKSPLLLLSLLFGDTFSSFDQSIQTGNFDTLFPFFPFPKIDFRTFQK
jgi:hypothetical protein